MRSRDRGPQLRFTCPVEDYGAIAEPVPAQKALPEWHRQMPTVREDCASAFTDGSTVKRCLPFADAMSLGWVVPMAVSIQIEVRGGFVTTGWEYPGVMVTEHIGFQIDGSPHAGRQPLKYHNPWVITTAPGWSCLVTPALNRPGIMEFFSGVIDSDRLRSPTNFPFVVTAPDGVYTVERGTPLVQVIPFRRDDLSATDVDIRAETPDEAAARNTHHRSALASRRWYVREIRARRNRANG